MNKLPALLRKCRELGYLKQIKHTVEIDGFADVDLVLGLYHVVQQHFQNHGAAETAPLNFKIGKAHGQIYPLYIVNPDEGGA